MIGYFPQTVLNAQKTLQSRIRTNLSSTKDSLHKLDSIVNRYKISDNQLALHYAKNALKVAQVKNSPDDLITAYMLMGMVYLNGKKDSSLIFNNKALSIADSNDALKKWKVPIMYNIAMIYNGALDNKTAISYLDSSIALARIIRDSSGMARGLIALGTIKYDIHDYQDSKRMYDSAVQISLKYKLNLHLGVAEGNLARFDTNEKSAIIKLKKALAILKSEPGTEQEMAMILINLGNYYSAPDSSIYYNKAAIQLCSGNCLPEILMAAYNTLAYNYIDKGDLSTAEFFLRDKAIPIAEKENNNDWLSTLNDTYADLFALKGDYKNAFNKQKEAFNKRQEASRQSGTEQVRLLSALLDLKNKELIIQNEGRELLIQKNRLQNMELWIAGLILLIVVSILITLFLQQRHRARLHNEQMSSARRIIEREESEKGRTARELHDITGQLVMGITGEIENLDLPDQESKEALQNKIKALGRSIRQISHRMNRAMIEHFTFQELIAGQCEDVMRLSGLPVELEMDDNFPDFPREVVLHFYRIIQELLTNATKYAANSKVRIKITTGENRLKLFYSDDGPGFEKKEKSMSGMGIMNIFERTKLIGGEAIVNSAQGKGTSWEISFPISQKENIIS
jgi:signal transduction histidine kinase